MTTTTKKWYRTRSSTWITRYLASSFVMVWLSNPILKFTPHLTFIDILLTHVWPFFFFMDLIDAKDLVESILKEDPKERLSIDQILNHSWWQPRSDDDEEDTEEAKDEEEFIGAHHGRQGSLTKREIHPVQSTQRLPDIFGGSGSPQFPSPLAHPYGAWGSQSPYTFNPAAGDSLRAFPGATNNPSPISSPLPSPSPMVNKSFPRYESESVSRSGSFPGNGFEQRLLLTLGKMGFDQEMFSKSVPAQSCDPGYGLWCLLVDQVRQRAVDNGTSVDWEQSVSLVDMTTITGVGATGGLSNGALIMMESGKKSPRPMSDPSPTSSQTNLLLPQVLHYQPSPSLQQQEFEQQTTELKAQLDQYKLETELLKVQKQQLEKEMTLLTTHSQSTVKVHPFESKELPPITAEAVASAEACDAKSDRVQDSGISVSTSSTPNSSWEIAEREAMATMERPRRKSKGILHSIKDRLFSSGNNSDEGSHSNTPSPVPTRHMMGHPGSASSSTSSATTFAPKPLPAPPAHPYPYMAQLPSTHSPLSAVSYKSASTSSLAMDTGRATSPSSGYNALSSDHLTFHDSETTHKKGGFRTWITESAQGTVLNKTPVVQNNAKVPKRLNARSFSTADPFPPSTSSSEEVRPQIPAIPASFFQPIWKLGGHSASSPPNASVLASSAPGMSIRQRLASFSSSTSAKISPEERQRAAAAAAAAAALVADPSPARIAMPERAHSPSPPSSPRGSEMHSLSHMVAAHEKQDQSEINDIVAAAVAATASAHLESAASRKKHLGLSGSKKSKSSTEKSKSSKKSISSHIPLEQHGRSATEPASKASGLQIPLATSSTISTPSKDSSSKGHSRKPSIKSSKATMPSLMTAFSPFKPSKSAPSSPNVHRSVQLPEPNLDYYPVNNSSGKDSKYTSGRHDEPSNLSRVMSNSGSTKMAATTHPSINNNLPSLPSSPLPKQGSEHTSPTTFGDGVIVQDEPARTKKRTTSRTSITAASLGRKSSDSVASAMIAANVEPVPPHPEGATTPTSAVPPSKRASLGSLSSRRSSSSSMRDRNIYGLTLDSGSGSRKSSLNLTRAPLSKSTFHSPSSSPGQPRRGGEMDRPLHSRASEDRIKTSTSIREEGEFEGPPLETLRRPGHSRESSLNHIIKSSRPMENYPSHAPSPTLQPRGSTLLGSTLEEPATDGACSASVIGSGTSAITISPSLSASSSLTRVATSDKEETIRKIPEVHVDDSNPISFDTTDGPRINFEDGCSLIPSPPPSPAPIAESVRFATLAPVAVHMKESSSSSIHLEEPKTSYLSTSFPPPRTSLSYNDSVSDLGTSPSPPRSLVSFDQHFANQSKIKDYRDSTTPRKVVNGFQPLAAKRLSKPGLPNSTSPTPGTDSVPVPAIPSNEDTLGPINRFSSNLSSSFSNNSMLGNNGPPNAFAGRRRGYRNSTGSMANMTLQQQQNFQQLQQEQLLKIQGQQRQQFTPNAGYEATAAMKMNPRPRTGYFPKREFGGVALGGLGGQNGSPLSNGAIMGSSGLGNPSPGFGGFDDVGASGKRDSYSSRRQSMATAMGKRAGAAPAAIQEEEE